ncbi:SagB-type dehydrogenase domain-containing protein [Pseudomonas extremaustralis]|uniref:SagB/ThcOx family dehydrogenase n=1 Tax=Pseudomonas extremaustralis TaxID=359110 RepID=UPI00099B2DE1|nr:SagB/ThcOx family dehydrogenase [Pseudomonas extremaustralis]SKB01973.1 SagB-type dehydrogenase domain-containing protein [Pseudomonas extremaustralis]
MKNIPHDYYLRFVDAWVYEEVLDFHSKGNFTLHRAFKDRVGLHFLNEKQLVQLTGNELVLYPDMDLTVGFALPKEDIENHLSRNESCERFLSESLDFADVERLIFPLLSKEGGSYKRGYPSAGALYPAEIFICSLSNENTSWPEAGKILHLLPRSRKFEIMQGEADPELLKSAIMESANDIGSPSMAIIYVAYMPKSLFKYRYRGYRMSLMEIGSIYMLVELQAKSLGLACRLWSAYTDSMLCKVLGVNPALFFPMCVHFIGKRHETY